MNDKPAGFIKDDLTINRFTPRPPARAKQVNLEEASSRSRSRGPVPPQSPASAAAATAAQGSRPVKASPAAPRPTSLVEKRQEQRRYRRQNRN